MDEEQKLLAEVMNLFADQFPRRAILRGGMVLRVLGSPRFTNDLDYVFIPYRSKKDIMKQVVSVLQGMEGLTVSHTINSKCLRLVLKRGGATVQVEAKVAMETPTEEASTRLVGSPFHLPPKLLLVVRHDVALANKLAAWNERRLARDLYDIWFFLQMGVRPEPETLRQRLNKPSYSRLVKAKDLFAGTEIAEFYEFLRDQIAQLPEGKLEQSLLAYLPQEEVTGIRMQILASLTKLRA